MKLSGPGKVMFHIGTFWVNFFSKLNYLKTPTTPYLTGRIGSSGDAGLAGKILRENFSDFSVFRNFVFF